MAAVAFTDFQRQTSRTLVLGTVENRSKAAREYTLDFELLGKDGAVLQKATATVPSVAAGATGNFMRGRSDRRRVRCAMMLRCRVEKEMRSQRLGVRSATSACRQPKRAHSSIG